MNAELQDRIAQLPPLPQAVLALQATLQDESASVADCALRIRQDPALTARLLRLANSAFYGVPGRVGGIDDAVQLIGLRSLRLLAMTAAVSMQFEPPRAPAGWLGAFWRHALAVAHLAQGLAELRGQPVERAYVAGLLHDIGRLVLATRRAPASDNGDDNHAEVGAAVARHWHLPPAVAQAIASHHAPAAGKDAGLSLVDIVHVADALAHGHGFGYGKPEHAPVIDAAAWQRLGGDALDLSALVERVHRAVDDTCQALGVASTSSRTEELPA
jgi:putative nucleotidyltransferase with HDIG domain